MKRTNSILKNLMFHEMIMNINRLRYRALLFTILLIFSSSCSKGNNANLEGNNISGSNYLEAHEQNFDTLKLQALVSKIKNGKFGDVHSLIISRNNHIVLEEYFNGYNRDRLHRLYSATKSVTSALIGIAIDNDLIDNLEEKTLGFFPEYNTINNLSLEKENMTLENVLTMSAGFEWDEWSNPYGHSNNSATILWESNDMIKHMLDLPLTHTPGTHFTYNSGCSILLSGIIRNRSGKSAEQYASSELFSKIGIENWDWWHGNDGLTWTSGELYLRPIDILKFGQLYLNKGNWNGTQVISESWIETSTEAKISITDYNDYAYHWWKYSGEHYVYDNIEDTDDIYYAIGHAGQFIWVLPHYNMVIVSTAGNESVTRKSEPMLWWDILPAVND